MNQPSDRSTEAGSTEAVSGSRAVAKAFEQSAVPFEMDGDADLLSVYLQRYDRKQTRRAYRNDLVQFFGTETVDLGLARQPTFMHVNEHLSDMSAEGLKASTMRRRIAAVRGFYDWLLALELVDRNPANRQLVRRVRKVSRKDRSIKYLSGQEASKLLKATENAGEASVRDHALLTTLLHCVLRRSEAAGMDAKHIRPLGRYWVLDLPQAKGGSNQYVKMPAHVVERIDHMKMHYGIQSGALWRSLSNRNRGERLSPAAIYEMVKRTAERAGLSDVGAHTLRHTGCTLAIEAGASLQQVQTHARHKNLETTMVYIHQRDKLRDSAADRIQIDEK